jgi:uncharacterized protein
MPRLTEPRHHDHRRGAGVNETDVIVRIVREHYPTTQAIYLFGTYGTTDEWPDSDVDIAVLLPPEEARRQPQLMLTPCHYALADALGRPVDLLNAREVSTVFRKEIVKSGRRLYCTDEDAVAEFEMLTLSYYQQLNEERRAILEAFQETGRAYAV